MAAKVAQALLLLATDADVAVAGAVAAAAAPADFTAVAAADAEMGFSRLDRPTDRLSIPHLPREMPQVSGDL